MNVGWLVQRGVTRYCMLYVKIKPDRRQALDIQILQSKSNAETWFWFCIGSLHLSSSKKKKGGGKDRKFPTSFPEKWQKESRGEVLGLEEVFIDVFLALCNMGLGYV